MAYHGPVACCPYASGEMVAPLRSTHVMLTTEQLQYLQITAAKRHLSVSQLIRELVDRDRARERAANRRRQAEGD